MNALISKVDTNKTGYVVEWTSCGAPTNDSVVKYELVFDKEKEGIGIKATNPKTNISYNGYSYNPDEFNMYLAEVVDDSIELHHCKYFKMVPFIKTEIRKSSNELNDKEKFLELRMRFGSKKACHLAEQYVNMNNIKKDVISNELVESINESTKNIEIIKNTLDADTSTSITPPRNENAVEISQVYKINDIISDEIKTSIKYFLDSNTLETFITNNLIKSQIDSIKAKEDKEIIAIFLEVASRILAVNPMGWRNANVLLDLDSNLREVFFAKYTVPRKDKSFLKRNLTPFLRDKLSVDVIILYFFLTNFIPVEENSLLESFNIQGKRIKKLSEAIGCVYESKTKRGSLQRNIIFKLPLPKASKNTKKPNARSFFSF